MQQGGQIEDDDDDLSPRSLANKPSTHPVIRSNGPLVAPPGIGVFDSLNSNLRADVLATRAEVARLKEEAAERGRKLAEALEEDEVAATGVDEGDGELDDEEDGHINITDELKRLNELLAEELSEDEEDTNDTSSNVPSHLKSTASSHEKRSSNNSTSNLRAKTAEKGATRTKPIASSNNFTSTTLLPDTNRKSRSSSNGTRRGIGSASTTHQPQQQSSPTSASSSPLSPSQHATMQRSRDVLSNYRAKQSSITAYEQEQQAARRNEGELEGTIKLKADLGEQCPICLDEMVALERVASLSCCHTFHAVCILEWMKRSNACPMCKTEGFHPLAAIARQQNQPPSSDESSSNSTSAASISSRSTPNGRPSSALLDAATRSRLRQLRAERIQADSAASDARRVSTQASSSSIEKRAASAASRAANAAALLHQRSAQVGQMSLSQLLASASPPGSRQYGLLTSSSSNPSPSTSSSNSSHRAGSAGTSTPTNPRPSSNSSTIRAAAAATLSLAPTVTKVGSGKLATGSTVRTNRLTK